jgi:hypothetical protein
MSKEKKAQQTIENEKDDKVKQVIFSSTKLRNTWLINRKNVSLRKI